MTLNEAKLNQFINQAVGDVGTTMSSILVVIGDRLGLAADGPCTAAELSSRTETAERYVREWLDAQASAGYVTYDPETRRYSLPAEQAAALADETSPAFFPGPVRSRTAKVADRIRFEVASATDFPGNGYELVAHFDCLHDMQDPKGAARRVRENPAASANSAAPLKPPSTWSRKLARSVGWIGAGA